IERVDVGLSPQRSNFSLFDAVLIGKIVIQYMNDAQLQRITHIPAERDRSLEVPIKIRLGGPIATSRQSIRDRVHLGVVCGDNDDVGKRSKGVCYIRIRNHRLIGHRVKVALKGMAVRPGDVMKITVGSLAARVLEKRQPAFDENALTAARREQQE